MTKKLFKEFEDYAKAKVAKEVKRQRELMECGHPLAALNHSYGGDPTRVVTMYCRSCEIQARRGIVSAKEST